MGWLLAILGTLLGIGTIKKAVSSNDNSIPPIGVPHYTVESWRGIVSEKAGNIPVNFILKWIQVESDGNPCATGGHMANSTDVKETGLFQFYYPDDYIKLGLDTNHLRAYCGAKASQTCTRMLSGDEINYQIDAGLHYINLCRDKATHDLANVGASWSGTDYWMMVKMQHNSPALSSPGLGRVYRILGKAPDNWRQYRDTVMANKSTWPAGYDSSTVAQVLNNAQKVGIAAAYLPSAGV